MVTDLVCMKCFVIAKKKKRERQIFEKLWQTESAAAAAVIIIIIMVSMKAVANVAQTRLESFS